MCDFPPPRAPFLSTSEEEPHLGSGISLYYKGREVTVYFRAAARIKHTRTSRSSPKS